MPLAGEDYSLQPWGYLSEPSTFSESVNLVWRRVMISAKVWSPRIGEALTTITGMFPDVIFDVLNTSIFVWLMIILFVIGFGRFPIAFKIKDTISLLIIFFLFITLFPLIGQLVFWKAGACNHTWGLTILLSFILPYRLNDKTDHSIESKFILVLFILLGFLAGLTIENAVIVVFGLLLMYYYLSRRKEKINIEYFYPIISFIVGIAILLFSPGTTNRRQYYSSQSSDFNLSGFSLYFDRLVRITSDYFRLSWALVLIFSISLVIFYFLFRKGKAERKEKKFFSSSKLSFSDILILFVFSILSVMILISISYHTDQSRGFAFSWLITISLTAYMITEILFQLKSRRFIYMVLLSTICLTILQMVNIGILYDQLSLEYKKRQEIIYSSIIRGEKEISLPAIRVEESRLISTREGLPDLGDRLAKYYGFDLVIIQE